RHTRSKRDWSSDVCSSDLTFDLAALEKTAREALQGQYPKFRTQFLEEHRIEQKADQPTQVSAQRRLQAFQFLQEDEKQLVQVRIDRKRRRVGRECRSRGWK